MKKSYMSRVLPVLMLSILMLMGVKQVEAQSQMANMMGHAPQFKPATGWAVQPALIGGSGEPLKELKLPCMMAANYDNGYSVRFSGANGHMLAMAIDFRQNVFTQGRKYPANINLDGTYEREISATAFTPSSLIFNMRDVRGFYNAMSGAKEMMLNVEGNVMNFSLGSVQNALADLSRCSAGKPVGVKASLQEAALPVVKDAAPRGVPMTQVMKPVAPVTAEPLAPRMPVSVNLTPKTKTNAYVPSIPRPTAPTGPVWEAKAGQDMKLVLQGWAARADVALDWQATGPSTVVDDVRVVGTFQEAVQTLMARNSAALGLDANLNLGGSTPATAHNSATLMGYPKGSEATVVSPKPVKSAYTYRPRVSLPVD